MKQRFDQFKQPPQEPSSCPPDGSHEGHPSKAYLTTREAATFLGFAPITLATWRCTGKGPGFIRLGRVIRYRRSDLDKFMDCHLLGNAESKETIKNSPQDSIDQEDSIEDHLDIFG